MSTATVKFPIITVLGLPPQVTAEQKTLLKRTQMLRENFEEERNPLIDEIKKGIVIYDGGKR